MEEPQHQQQTSLRFLRLQHDFQTMVKTGIGCVDEEVGCRSSLQRQKAGHVGVVLISSKLILAPACRPSQPCSRDGRHHTKSDTLGSCCSK